MTEEATPKKTSKAGWKKRKVHEDVTLPSGAVVDITIPNLPALASAGQLPNHLLEVAAGVAAGTAQPDEDFFKKEKEFTDKIVALTVVNPKIEEAEVDDVVPYEDQTFIARLALRQEDTDAVGKHLGGLHTQASFRQSRGLDVGYEGFSGI